MVPVLLSHDPSIFFSSFLSPFHLFPSTSSLSFLSFLPGRHQTMLHPTSKTVYVLPSPDPFLIFSFLSSTFPGARFSFCFYIPCYFYLVVIKQEQCTSKTVHVLPSLEAHLIFSFHLLPYLVPDFLSILSQISLSFLFCCHETTTSKGYLNSKRFHILLSLHSFSYISFSFFLPRCFDHLLSCWHQPRELLLFCNYNRYLTARMFPYKTYKISKIYYKICNN